MSQSFSTLGLALIEPMSSALFRLQAADAGWVCRLGLAA